MNEENKEVKKEELSDEQVENATGGATMTCPGCKRTITYGTTKPTKCSYCGMILKTLRY